MDKFANCKTKADSEAVIRSWNDDELKAEMKYAEWRCGFIYNTLLKLAVMPMAMVLLYGTAFLLLSLGLYPAHPTLTTVITVIVAMVPTVGIYIYHSRQTWRIEKRYLIMYGVLGDRMRARIEQQQSAE